MHITYHGKKCCCSLEQSQSTTVSLRKHTTVQFHYDNWPDDRVPNSTNDILQLIQDVRAEIANMGPRRNFKVLVHCADGSNQTGTFLSIYQLISIIESELKTSNVQKIACLEHGKITIDVFDTVFRLRHKRMAMVGKVNIDLLHFE